MSEDLQSLTRATPTIESEHADSLYHPFDRKGNKHMEYVTDRGEFEDAPIDAMIATFREKYSQIRAEGLQGFSRSNFEAEVEAETAESG